ncbi:MAG: hypothetical protein L0Z62_40825 [Gemmataceae bacterium]|nr:hypothetical protein [Gemmataceae bacterium]
MIMRPLFASLALGGALLLAGCCCPPRRPCPPPAVVGTAQVGEPCCNGAGPGVGGIPPPPAPVGGIPPAGPFAPPPNGGFR